MTLPDQHLIITVGYSEDRNGSTVVYRMERNRTASRVCETEMVAVLSEVDLSEVSVPFRAM